MWPRKLKKVIRNPVPQPAVTSTPQAQPAQGDWKRTPAVAALLVCAILLTGCGQGSEPDQRAGTSNGRALPDENTFSVLSFNLDRFGFDDRTSDGQVVDMKPEAELQAVFSILADLRPDILAVQELGGGDVYATFLDTLTERGLDYPFHTILEQEGSEFHLALFSRFPFTSLQLHKDDRFTADGQSFPVKRGFIEADIAVNPNYSFRIIVAQLKSKAFHPVGHSELRRNEARILNNWVRRYLGRERRLNLLVVGDFADPISSAAMRTITGDQQQFLSPLRLADAYGDIWTHFDADSDTYHRYDFMLVSSHMLPEFIPEASSVVRHPKNRLASNRRPLLAVFHAREMDPHSSLMLPAYEFDDE